jgi:hypothetical protein
MFIEDLSDYLLANTGVAAIAGTNVFPGVLPQNTTPPAVVYRLAAGPGSKLSLEGKGQIREPIFEFDAVALDLKTAAQLDAAVVAALEGFRGFMGATEVLGIFVHSEPREAYDLERLQHYWQRDFRIWYRDIASGGVAGGAASFQMTTIFVLLNFN